MTMKAGLAERVDEIADKDFDGFRSRVLVDAIHVYALLHDIWGKDYERNVAELRLAAAASAPTLRDRVRNAGIRSVPEA